MMREAQVEPQPSHILESRAVRPQRHALMHSSLEQLDHRPWPLPEGRWSWRQGWRDLLFAHWPVPAATLRPLIPGRLTLQEFDGTAWLGVVPFRMVGVSRRPLPDLPGLSAFPEINVRTYVEHGGKSGVWFLSLDATNVLAVWGARALFHLPYFRARMALSGLPDRVEYSSVRRGPEALTFAATYEPTSDPYHAAPGSLEHWLTERYCLYAESPTGQLTRTEVHHWPWTLQAARVDIERNDLVKPHGLSLDGPPALSLFSRKLDVVVWSPEIVGL